MALPVEKVEVGFDVSFSGAGNFLTLDDPVKGKLDDASYPLRWAFSLFDVTSRR